MNHHLVPKHYVVSEQEKQALLEKYKITKMSQFPTIKVTDPAIKAIDAKIGDLVKIMRKSNVSKEMAYYRVVVE